MIEMILWKITRLTYYPPWCFGDRLQRWCYKQNGRLLEWLLLRFHNDLSDIDHKKLCYKHHCEEFDKLPNARRHEASGWLTVEPESCENCWRYPNCGDCTTYRMEKEKQGMAMFSSENYIKDTNRVPIIIDPYFPFWAVFPTWALFLLVLPEHMGDLVLWWGIN